MEYSLNDRLILLIWPMANDERDLIQKLKAKDNEASDKIVRLHTKHLYKACLGLGFTEFEAEDITQSVWITFFEVIHKFEGRSTLRTFLFGILYNKASEIRKQIKRAEPSEDIEGILDSHFDERGKWILPHSPVNPERFLQSSQTLTIISKCLELLPMNQKMAFVLKEIEDEATEEICNVLNVTATHLGVLLFRARNQLRECIDHKSR